jgi:hypothetical protein
MGCVITRHKTSMIVNFLDVRVLSSAPLLGQRGESMVEIEITSFLLFVNLPFRSVLDIV